jgi:hypothetical protein
MSVFNLDLLRKAGALVAGFQPEGMPYIIGEPGTHPTRVRWEYCRCFKEFKEKPCPLP